MRIPALRVAGLSPTPTVRPPNRGATMTNLSSPQMSADVSNQPSVKVMTRPDGSAEVVIRRNTRFTGMIDEGDLNGLKRIVAGMVDEAERYSQGGLSTVQLKRMGNPYGRNASGQMRGKLGRGGARVKGVRGSVPNLSVINRQSGLLARSYSGKVTHDVSGAEMRLINSAPYAGALALGTRKMQAHGPWTRIPAQQTTAINSEWQRIVREATRRKSNEKTIERGVMRSLGII